MTIGTEIAWGVGPKANKTPRFPPAYGAYLERVAKAAGIDRDDLVAWTGLDKNTIYRNLAGRPERSMLAANKIRAALLGRGLTVDPVPNESEGWTDPGERAPQTRVPQLSQEAEIFRRNLVAFREERGLDLHDAAQAAGIPLETLRAYELGNASVSGLHLLELARVYDRGPDHFDMKEPPQRARRAPPTIHARIVGNADDMTPEHRARFMELQRELAEINAAERRRAEQTSKPKRK
jgi:transcriptional regulator with XRE-family HTH domain